jgi:predicted AlkP superfamily phosphohydrolase/phosphomutase
LIEEDVDKQTDVFEHLFAEKPWRFGIVFFSATAIAQHYFWADMAAADLADPYRNVVETAYRAVDRAVARLCRAVGRDTTIFVISECGAGPLRSGVQINTLLERHGFLRYCRQAGLGGSRRLVAAGRKQAQGLLQRWLPDAMYYRLNHGLRATKARVQSFLADSDIDWAKTTAFSRGKEGEVFVNLHGRDPRGVVAPGAEYEAVRDRLIECFASLRDPNTGENAVEHVYRREALYQGPMLEWAPDLVVAWKDAAYMPTENDKNKNEIFVTRWREYMNWPTSGSHRVDGVLIANGPGIRRGAVVEGARIIDLAPTWLRCLDQPITGKLEGRVIEGLFEPDTAPVTKSVAA